MSGHLLSPNMTMTSKKREFFFPEPPNIESKARQNTKLLIVNPEFRDAIEELRKKWGIEEGNPDRTKNITNLPMPDLFQLDNEDAEIPLSSSESFKDAVYKRNTKHHKDITELLKRFKLDREYWIKFLWQYAVYGVHDNDTLFSETAPILRIQTQPESGESKILLELGKNTTLKDVKKSWYAVEAMKKFIYPNKGKFKEWKNIDRDAKIYTLSEQEKTIDEISSVLLKDGVDLDYGNIKKIVSTFKKKMKIKKVGKKLFTSKIKHGIR